MMQLEEELMGGCGLSLSCCLMAASIDGGVERQRKREGTGVEERERELEFGWRRRGGMSEKQGLCFAFVE